MIPTIVHLDTKYRIVIPKGAKDFFPDKVVYWGLRTHALLIWGKPYSEIGTYKESVDKAWRILVWKDLLLILGISNEDSKLNQVLWVPYTTRDSTEFLLFFWESGEQTWRNILATKTAVKPLLLTA